MTHSVFLGEKYIQESPAYFRNFLATIPEWSADAINQALATYHAEYVIRKNHGVVLEFNDEKDYTFFLLRWS